jgi:branched-chain amino acid aminotransferase
MREVPLTRHEVYGADEAFLSSTTKELLPITMVDGRRIGKGVPGVLTRRLHRAFRTLVLQELRRDVGGVHREG